MRNLIVLLVGIVVLLLPPREAEARRFDMKSEKFGVYFGGTYGVSNMSDAAFGLSAGPGVTTDQIVHSNLSGELGIILGMGSAQVRAGGEYVFARNINAAFGLDSTGAKMYEVDSKVGAFMPTLAVEMALLKGQESRVVFGVGGGYAMLSFDQTYRMTASGITQLGVNDFVEKATGQTLTWKAYLSAETLLADTTTINLEVGYRDVRISSIQSSQDTTALVGSEPQGSNLKNTDGSDRSFDLGGGYAGLYFRFYL